MPNVLDPLIPSLTAALTQVARESTPINEVVDTSYGVEAAALGQSITVPSAGAVTGQDITAGATPPAAGDVTATGTAVTISKARSFPFTLSGEELKGMRNMGAQFKSMQVQEALRAMMNEVWTDVLATAKQAAYAFGTAGTNPFASNTDAMWDLYRMFREARAPEGGRSLILDPITESYLGKRFQTVSAVGQAETFQRAIFPSIANIVPRGANAAYSHTKGTGANYQVNKAAGYAIGDKAIEVDTGTGTIVGGEVITWAGDTTKYVVKSYDSTAKIVTLNQGLKKALADDTAMTIVDGGVRLLALQKSAIAWGFRPPALPEEGDSAADRVLITDPVTGIVVSFAVYKEYHRVRYQAELAWGGKAVIPAYLNLLLT